MMHLKDPAPRITANSKYDEFFGTRGMRVLAVVNSTKSEEAKLFKNWARRHTMHMAAPAATVTPGTQLDYINEQLVSKELLKQNLTAPCLVVFPHDSELTANHSKAVRLQDAVFKDKGTLEVWILLSLPPVLHVTPFTEEALIQRQISFHGPANAQPLITLWMHEDYKKDYPANPEKLKKAQDIVANFTKSVKKYFLNFTFAVQNMADIKEDLRDKHGPTEYGIDLQDGDIAIVARGGPPNMHFRWVCPDARNETGGFNNTVLTEWFEGLRDGTAERHEQSEPLPEYSGGETIRKLVAKNLNKEVVTTDKPMLLYFHAGWCAGCKQWESTFDKIAQNASDM